MPVHLRIIGVGRVAPERGADQLQKAAGRGTMDR
jgi:hypothetical protein